MAALPPPQHLPTARTVAFVMALLGCLLIMYKAVWYDQFSCPDGFLLRVRWAETQGPGAPHPPSWPQPAS